MSYEKGFEKTVVIELTDGSKSLRLEIKGYEKGMFRDVTRKAVSDEYLVPLKRQLDQVAYIYQALQDTGGLGEENES